MKRKPIKARKIGCGNCGNNYEVLPEEYIFDGHGVHMYTLRIDRKYIDLDKTDLKKVREKFGEAFKLADCIEISVMTPLHDETYELCKETDEFLLVEQGIGYA